MATAAATPAAPRARGERRLFRDAPSRVREYETIYILAPNVSREEAEKVAGRVTEIIERLKGTLVQVDTWGRRKLAYPIRKHLRGHFIYLKYLGVEGLVAELERNLRMLDAVLRYQTVKLQDVVDPATVQVDPEQTHFAPIEVMAVEDDKAEAAEAAADEDEAAADSASASEGEAAADGASLPVGESGAPAQAAEE
ncbi:MAG: 30S ribosomal protein S6, partial [Polyangiales bacterium]